VGIARKDGENGAQAMLQHLQTASHPADHSKALSEFEKALNRSGQRIITREDVVKLAEFEQAEAERLGVEEFKLKTNEEMLAVVQ
jgi:tetraacyldisaccharide-1-P 4'-kinase